MRASVSERSKLIRHSERSEESMKYKKTIFLTGATGILGSYLLKILLKNDCRVFVLGRPNKVYSARERVIYKLKFWDKLPSLKNLNVVDGDITLPFLGLKEDVFNRLSREVEVIYHSAAITNLNWKWADIKKINVLGAKNVFDFGLACSKFRLIKINHISTAYIYGSSKKRFNEGNFNVGQGFNTSYDKSKFEAEKVALNYRKKGLWIDISRPPIIIGRSTDGKITQFKNIYQLLHICKMEIFDTLPVKGLKAVVVPVDEVSKAIILLSDNSKLKNCVYHPFSDQKINISDVVKVGCGLLKAAAPKIIPLKDIDYSKITPAGRTILKNNILSMNFTGNLDSKMTQRLLKKLKFKFTRPDTGALQKILKFYNP